VTTRTPTILAHHDAGLSAQQIALACSVSAGYVYGILRAHRKGRTRKARTRTSEKRTLALGLHGQGIAPVRIAFLCGVSPAYIYRILGEQ
jgi:hypothetical protein